VAAFDIISNDNSVIVRQRIQPDVEPLAPDRLTQRFYSRINVSASVIIGMLAHAKLASARFRDVPSCLTYDDC
jgi:hypothetical protein